jgi:nucleoid-associated protein YgaU
VGLVSKAISERFYGDGARYRQIAEASGITDDVSDPKQPLGVGETLIIPVVAPTPRRPA